MNDLLDNPNDYEQDPLDKKADEWLLTSGVKKLVEKAQKRINKNIRKEKIKKLLNEND